MTFSGFYNVSIFHSVNHNIDYNFYNLFHVRQRGVFKPESSFLDEAWNFPELSSTTPMSIIKALALFEHLAGC